MTTPWLIHFFERHPDDDPNRSVPVRDFFDALPAKVVAEIQAVLDAVADAPSPAFSGGGKWEAMHGLMAGFFEIRVRAGSLNYRVFCVLERDAEDLGGSSIVAIDSLSKAKRSAAETRDYRRALGYLAEFRRRRTVLR